MLRMLNGPFSLPAVVFSHYLMRLWTTIMMTMITFNRVLKTLFIIDFQRISLIPEEKVMKLFGFTTFLSSVIYLLQEVAVRYLRGLNHFGRNFAVYLGKVGYQLCIILDIPLFTILGQYSCAEAWRRWDRWSPRVPLHWPLPFLPLSTFHQVAAEKEDIAPEIP